MYAFWATLAEWKLNVHDLSQSESITWLWQHLRLLIIIRIVAFGLSMTWWEESISWLWPHLRLLSGWLVLSLPAPADKVCIKVEGTKKWIVFHFGQTSSPPWQSLWKQLRSTYRTSWFSQYCCKCNLNSSLYHWPEWTWLQLLQKRMKGVCSPPQNKICKRYLPQLRVLVLE